jgi:hypothetical protein
MIHIHFFFFQNPIKFLFKKIIKPIKFTPIFLPNQLFKHLTKKKRHDQRKLKNSITKFISTVASEK